ncbi:MAG: Do family serine endopeptidase [Deltaproteobacteria bacterium]|nr:Do family serine endopeptidase [Deltaproteobacteria bacterium]
MSKRALTWIAAAGIAAAFTIVPHITNNDRGQVALAQPLKNKRGESIADVTDKVLPSVVSIAVKGTTGVRRRTSGRYGSPFGDRFRQIPKRGIGSGVIVSNKGFVLTNNHVVDGADKIQVKLADGRETTARVIGTDPKSDLAVLRLDKRLRGLKPLPLGNSSRLRLGEVVLAVGNPMGVGQSVTMGIVSAKGRGSMGLVDYGDFIQTDAAINPGNSGGALVNMNGELVGINTAILSRSGGYQGIGFAIPSDMAKPIMRMLIKNGKVTRGYLGVSIQPLTDELASSLKLDVPGNRGVLVSDVLGGSPARKAGLRRNDVVVTLDGKQIKRSERFRNLVAARGAGAVVTLGVIRGGKRVQLPVKLGKLPSERGVVSKRRAKTDALGVRLAAVNDQTRRRYDLPRDLRYGVVVTDVQPGSQADMLGVRKGDVILELNRKRIRSARNFKNAYDRAKSRIALLFWRDGMTSYIVVPK